MKYITTDGQEFTDVHAALAHAVFLCPGNPTLDDVEDVEDARGGGVAEAEALSAMDKLQETLEVVPHRAPAQPEPVKEETPVAGPEPVKEETPVADPEPVPVAKPAAAKKPKATTTKKNA
jgi:hypothetical protein